MDHARREQLEKKALQRLKAADDDSEKWSYAWAVEGAKDFSFCFWSRYEEEEFDGSVHGLDLP